MNWFFRYTEAGVVRVHRNSTPEEAIDAASRVIEAGGKVTAIGLGDEADDIVIEETRIARIHASWVKGRADQASWRCA
jgi:hypothetical protein